VSSFVFKPASTSLELRSTRSTDKTEPHAQRRPPSDARPGHHQPEGLPPHRRSRGCSAAAAPLSCRAPRRRWSSRRRKISGPAAGALQALEHITGATPAPAPAGIANQRLRPPSALHLRKRHCWAGDSADAAPPALRRLETQRLSRWAAHRPRAGSLFSASKISARRAGRSGGRCCVGDSACTVNRLAARLCPHRRQSHPPTRSKRQPAPC